VNTALHTRSLAVALGLTAFASAPSAAQSPARFGLDAGVTAPVSGYGNGKNLGYHLGLLVDVRIPASVLGFRVDGAFNEIGYSGNSTKEDIWLVNANALLKLPTGKTVVPYAIGGFGIYNSHRTLFLASNGSTDPGFNLGGGVRFERHDVTTFVEARYHKVSGDRGIRMVPITLGILF
jgi:outer membrane protein with beta-barrel domain